MLGGEGAILWRAWLALLHPFVNGMKNFKVGGAERKLRRPVCGFAGLDFVYPGKEMGNCPLIAASGFGGELHSSGVQLLIFRSFPSIVAVTAFDRGCVKTPCELES